MRSGSLSTTRSTSPSAACPFEFLVPAADPYISHSLTEYVEMHVGLRRSGFEQMQLVLTPQFILSTSPAEQKCCSNQAART